MTEEIKKRRVLNFETVGSITAMVIGMCALFVAWDQAQIMRKQQHASVLPVVNIDGGFSTSADAHVMTLSFSNDGIGPAIVESASLTLDGREISDWPDLRDGLLPPALHEGFESNLDTSIGVLAAGETSNSIVLTWSINDERTAAFEELKSRVFSSVNQGTQFSVCYCSVFERCWRTSADYAAKPNPVKQCEDAGEDVVVRLLQTISSNG
ncbi:MAG: hypothetical protein AAF936_09380 [Pseudomonadota bacterium]